MRRGIAIAVCAAALMLSAAACGDDEEPDSGSDGDAGQDVETYEDCEGDVGVSEETGEKPTVALPDCVPPTELVIEEVVPGEGDGAVAGDAVSVNYVGLAWSTSAEFDSSWERGEPFEVTPLGTAGVIDGWNEGLIGAKPGERRMLIIPPDKGYGQSGAGDLIGPGETLVFVVDVVEIK